MRYPLAAGPGRGGRGRNRRPSGGAKPAGRRARRPRPRGLRAAGTPLHDVLRLRLHGRACERVQGACRRGRKPRGSDKGARGPHRLSADIVGADKAAAGQRPQAAKHRQNRSPHQRHAGADPDHQKTPVRPRRSSRRRSSTPWPRKESARRPTPWPGARSRPATSVRTASTKPARRWTPIALASATGWSRTGTNPLARCHPNPWCRWRPRPSASATSR